MASVEDLPSDGVVALDHFAAGDAAGLMEADADPEHRRRFEFPDDFAPSSTHSEDVIRRWQRDRRLGRRYAFAVRDQATGELLGGCELLPLTDGVGNVSYWTLPRHRGRGVATRALRLVCSLAEERLGFRSLEIVADADHLASHAVARRCGFTEAGRREGRTLYVRGPERIGGEPLDEV